VLDEYTDEFGTNLESRIPEFNEQQGAAYQQRPTPEQGQIPPAGQYQQPYASPSRYQPPIYQQYVYQPPPVPPAQPSYQPAYQAPPSYARQDDRINSVFAEESQELKNLVNAENNTGCLRNLLFLLVCLAVVIGSFALSYLIGAKLIMPDKKLVPSFSVTRGVKKIKSLVDSSELVKDEKAFANYTAPPKPSLPPEVRYTPPPPAPPARPAPPVASAPKPAKPVTTGTMYRVIVGAYDTKQEAADVAANVRADGFPVYQYMADGKYRLQIGAFKSKALATALLKKAGEYGYNAFISIK
jgi:hypothetical protein